MPIRPVVITVIRLALGTIPANRSSSVSIWSALDGAGLVSAALHMRAAAACGIDSLPVVAQVPVLCARLMCPLPRHLPQEGLASLLRRNARPGVRGAVQDYLRFVTGACHIHPAS